MAERTQVSLRQPDLDNPKEVKRYLSHIMPVKRREMLSCSACGENLVEIIVTGEHPITLKYRADCPHCGDHSFVKEVTGTIKVAVETNNTHNCGHRDPMPGEDPDVVYFRTKVLHEKK